MKPEKRKGFVKLWRSYPADKILKGAIELGAYGWMLCQSAHAPIRVRYKNHVWDLEKGQFVTSVRDLAKALVLSERQTRTLIRKFIRCGFIDTKSDTRGTLVTICYYRELQGVDSMCDTQSDKAVTRKRHNGDTQNKKVRIREINKSMNVADLSKRPVSIMEAMDNHLKEGRVGS